MIKKKHIVLLAGLLRDLKARITPDAWMVVYQAICELCANENTGFEAERFRDLIERNDGRTADRETSK